MTTTNGRRKGKHTEDIASFAYTKKNIFLLDRISHRNLYVPLKPLAQFKPIIIVTLDSQVQNPAHAKALKFTDMLLSRDLRSQVKKIG
jgi:hypothetical protein